MKYTATELQYHNADLYWKDKEKSKFYNVFCMHFVKNQ